MCSSDPACSAQNAIQVTVNEGEGGEVFAVDWPIDVDYGGLAITAHPASTRIFWMQKFGMPPGIQGWDVHRIERGPCSGPNTTGFVCMGVDPYDPLGPSPVAGQAGGTAPDGTPGYFGGQIDALVPSNPDGACWRPDLAFTLGAVQSTLDTNEPPTGRAYFYQVGPGVNINFASTAGVGGGTPTLLGPDPTGGPLRRGACCTASGQPNCAAVTTPVVP
jgi:hypothetical protein